MDFIEDFRVSQERAEAGLRAEIDHPASIFGTWIIGGVGITEYTPAEGDEMRAFLLS